jgi:hypothetical protein
MRDLLIRVPRAWRFYITVAVLLGGVAVWVVAVDPPWLACLAVGALTGALADVLGDRWRDMDEEEKTNA